MTSVASPEIKVHSHLRFIRCELLVHSHLKFIRCELLHELNNGLYSTKWVHSHLLFSNLLCGLKISLMGYVPIFHDYVD